MPNWVEVFKTNLLEKCGDSSGSLNELATKLAKKLKEPVSVDALFNAHKRHKDRLKLKKSLMDYAGKKEKRPKKTKAEVIKPEDVHHSLSQETKKNIKSNSRFIITSAMNNCPLNENFWASVENYAKHNNASIIVIPVRYKNPTSQREAKRQEREDAWWDPRVEKYATDDLVKLHSTFYVMGHVRVQATAVNPLSGLDSMSGGASGVFGHSQLSMRMVATPQNKLPKVLWTTGSCTKKEYSKSKAGVKAKFHHVPGAVVVEIDGSVVHSRPITADHSGSFYDLEYHYTPKGVKKSKNILALVSGDEHAMFNDTKCREATYTGKNSITSVLKPERLVRHDVFDGYSISHHNREDPVIQYSKHYHGHHKVESELRLTLKHIESTTPKGVENIIVSSNHHKHLLQWMKEVHAPKKEPWNTKVWLELWMDLTKNISWEERGVVHEDPFARWIEARTNIPIKFLGPDSDERIADIAIGLHGHNGINGSRGSINQFAKIGVKTIVGHAHSPGIKFGCYQVGTSSTLRMDYTEGPSSWAHAHTIIHKNGKRQMIFVINGRWRLERS